MLLSLMVYVMTVSLFLGLAGWAFERAVRVFDFPTRWIWAGAMAGSFGYTLVAILRPPASALPLGTVVSTPLDALLIPVVGSITRLADVVTLRHWPRHAARCRLGGADSCGCRGPHAGPPAASVGPVHLDAVRAPWPGRSGFRRSWPRRRRMDPIGDRDAALGVWHATAGARVDAPARRGAL